METCIYCGEEEGHNPDCPVSLRLENAALKKRVEVLEKELADSKKLGDIWATKVISARERAEQAESRLERLREAMEEIVSWSTEWMNPCEEKAQFKDAQQRLKAVLDEVSK